MLCSQSRFFVLITFMFIGVLQNVHLDVEERINFIKMTCLLFDVDLGKSLTGPVIHERLGFPLENLYWSYQLECWTMIRVMSLGQPFGRSVSF